MEKKSYLLITGASSGIGREIALQLSEQYSIVLHDRDKERLIQTLEACNPNRDHLIWEYDLTMIDTLEDALTQFLLDNNCMISGFIHSAGHMKMVPLKMATFEQFRLSFDVHVIAAALVAKVLTKKKVNAGELKSIVFISSINSKFGVKAFSAYATSKAAVDGLMRSLALELAPAVRVNSVLPGGIRTPMTEHLYEDTALIERMYATYPLGSGSVKDIYGAVKFLISEDARWITGQQLVVDGGRTINITG
jgi:NAD(P)-dependent dehydrogenase (short-subunit alcohol dehydrogenase family)